MTDFITDTIRFIVRGVVVLVGIPVLLCLGAWLAWAAVNILPWPSLQ